MLPGLSDPLYLLLGRGRQHRPYAAAGGRGLEPGAREEGVVATGLNWPLESSSYGALLLQGPLLLLLLGLVGGGGNPGGAGLVGGMGCGLLPAVLNPLV